MPLVSILIANLNNGRYIKQTLESAVGQTHREIELVLADDGSTDDSIQVVQNFIVTHKEIPITLHRNDAPAGCGRIKRQLVELSHGDYFIFLDPEDSLTPEAVATLLAEHERGTEYSIVYGTHYLCDEHLMPQSISTYPGAIPEGQTHLTSTGGHISAPALCRRNCYDRTKGINAKYYVAEDHDLYLKMEEVAPVFFVNHPLYYYRHHDNNTSWNDGRRASNIRYRHLAFAAAYHRRKTLATPNLTRLQYHTECLNTHLQLYHISLKQKRAMSSIIQLLLASPYSYTILYNRNSK